MPATSRKKNNQMENNENYFVGIDVAKNELVVHVVPTNQQLTVPNSTKGIKELVALFKEINRLHYQRWSGKCAVCFVYGNVQCH